MKITFVSLMLLFIFVYGQAKEIKYTGSTPAAPVVRSFLGIPLSDSVDFIRWQLTLQDDHYTLNCNYGIAKPNTNGFMNDKQKLTFSGALIKEKNIYSLNSNGKTLYIIELNKDLLHLLDTNKKMLTGNG